MAQAGEVRGQRLADAVLRGRHGAPVRDGHARAASRDRGVQDVRRDGEAQEVQRREAAHVRVRLAGVCGGGADAVRWDAVGGGGSARGEGRWGAFGVGGGTAGGDCGRDYTRCAGGLFWTKTEEKV